MVLGAIMFYCHDAQSQISIRAFEFNANFNHSPAGTGAGSDLLGTDLKLNDLPGRSFDGGVEALVAIRLRARDIVFDPPQQGLV